MSHHCRRWLGVRFGPALRDGLRPGNLLRAAAVSLSKLTGGQWRLVEHDSNSISEWRIVDAVDLYDVDRYVECYNLY